MVSSVNNWKDEAECVVVCKMARSVLKVSEGDFPGGPEVKSLPSDARN